MSRPENHVEYWGPWKQALIVLVVDIGEAEGIASALGDHDGGAATIRELIAEAEVLEAEHEPSGKGPEA